MDGWTTRAKTIDLESPGAPARSGGQRTVAELYAQLEGVDGAKPSDPFAGE
jgi:hypothetical protein